MELTESESKIITINKKYKVKKIFEIILPLITIGVFGACTMVLYYSKVSPALNYVMLMASITLALVSFKVSDAFSEYQLKLLNVKIDDIQNAKSFEPEDKKDNEVKAYEDGEEEWKESQVGKIWKKVEEEEEMFTPIRL